jgi:hypothetical protein
MFIRLGKSLWCLYRQASIFDVYTGRQVSLMFIPAGKSLWCLYRQASLFDVYTGRQVSLMFIPSGKYLWCLYRCNGVGSFCLMIPWWNSEVKSWQNNDDSLVVINTVLGTRWQHIIRPLPTQSHVLANFNHWSWQQTLGDDKEEIWIRYQ